MKLNETQQVTFALGGPEELREFVSEQMPLALTEGEAEMFRRLVKRVCAHLAPFASDDEGKD